MWSGWPPDRGGWADRSGPLCGHTSRLSWFWGMLVRIVLLDVSWWGERSSDDMVTFLVGQDTVVVSVRWQEDLRCVFLMVLTHRLLFTPDTNPLWEPHSWLKFVDGGRSWDLSLGHHNGEGSLDGEAFWVGCGWFFLGGTGGEEETPGHVQQGRFFAGRNAFSKIPISLCYMLYFEQWGVSLYHASRPPRTGSPILDVLGRQVHVEVSTTWRPLSHTEDNVGTPTPCSVLHEQLVWCPRLMHIRSMLYVISVICYLMSRIMCVCTPYNDELVVGLRSQFCTLLEVWGDWELRCWLLTRKRLYTEDRGLQVPMVLEHDYITHTYNPHTYHIHAKLWGLNFCVTLSHPSFRTFHSWSALEQETRRYYI
jgi:hypothetical protein